MSPRWLKSLPIPLLRNMLILMAVGVMFIYSASFRSTGEYAVRQLYWILVSFVALFLTVRLGYRFFLGISYALYVVAAGFLIWVFFAGVVRLGAQRWLELGPFAFQPSEFAKLASVLALANFLGSRNPWEGEGKALAWTTLVIGVPLLMILKQPDLGTAVLLIPMGVVLLFLWGIRYRYLIVSFLVAVASSPLVWHFLKSYQKKRILVFLNPTLDPLGAGYTAIQSHIAVGSGGLFGKGWLHGTQSQLDFVPEHHTDFIFSVIAEELGFLGSLFLIVLYGTLFYQMFQVIERTTDIKARLLSAGVLSLIFFQTLINIGMSIGLLPITGVTLPLVSYGGSSLVATAIALGLLVSVHKERSIF